MTETWTTEQELFFLRQEYSILQGALDLANENLRKAEAKLQEHDGDLLLRDL